MGKLRFPAKGSVKPIPVFRPPVRVEGEADAAFDERLRLYGAVKEVIASVRMLGRDEATELVHRRGVLSFEVRALDPSLPLPLEWLQRWRALHRAIVIACVEGVSSVEVGGVDLESGLEPATLADMLDTADLLIQVATVAIEAQTPSKDVIDFLG